MAKKTKLQTDKFDLDDDLNFDDFGLEGIDNDINPEVRKTKSRDPVGEVFTGTLDGAKSKFKDPAFLASVVRKSLPSTYGEVLDKTNYVAGSLSSLYDEQVREIKPQLSRVAKKIDKLVPAESKTLKKITEKFKSLVGDEYEPAYVDKKGIQDKSVADALANVFNAQNEVNQEMAARDSVENRVKESVDNKRFQSNMGLLSSISDSVFRLNTYNERVNQAYQKKSLELQFRTYFVQSELLETTSKYFKVFQSQYEAISKNTFLPEYVKINNSERFKEIAKGKFINSVQSSLFGNGDFLKKGMDRVKGGVRAYIGGIKQALEQADMGLEALQGLEETNKSLMEAGMDPMTKMTMMGNMAGAGLMDFVGNKVGDKVKSYTEKMPGVVKAGYKAATVAKNLPGAIDNFRKSEYMSENYYDDGIKGKGVRALDLILGLFSEQSPDMAVDGLGGVKKLTDTAIFDNRTYRSITDVIPGYLSRILREVTVINTGDKKTGLTVYDFNKSTFMQSKELAADIKKRISEKFKNSSMDFYLSKAVDTLTDDNKLDDEQNVKVKKFMSQLSTIPNMDYSAETIFNTNAFKDLDPTTAELVRRLIESKMNDPESKDKFKYELTDSMHRVRSSMPDVRGDLESYIKAGQGDAVKKAGLAKKDKDGNYTIDEEGYYDLAREEGIRKSDINAKQGISKFNPKQALSAVKKTKVYEWFYKLGKGDDKKHVGPMAQDVNANMGEEAAPNGTMIDITTMNGINMSAIQALHDEQQKQVGSKDNYSVLQGIKDDTGNILRLMSSRSEGNSDSKSGSSKGSLASEKDGYTDIIGNIVTSTLTIASKAGSDLFNASSKALEFGKDKIFTPIKDSLKKAYTDNKDKVGKTFKDLLGKAGELGLKTLNFAQDVLFNKLPAGWRELGVLGKKGKDKIIEFINGPIDIYIKGIDKPFLRAKLMEMGYYIDQASGKVIKTIDDIKGPVIDKMGNIVLTAEDIAKGLVDKHGKDIKTTAGKVLSFVIGAAASGYNRAKEIFKSAVAGAKGIGSAIKDKFKGKFGDLNIPSVSIGTDRIYDVLVEIRGILRGENPPRHEEKKDFQKNFIGPKPQTTLSKTKEKAKQKFEDIKGKAKGKIDEVKKSSFVDKLKNTFKKKEDPEETSETSESEKVENKPRYGSDKNVVDSMISKGAGLVGAFTGKVKSVKESIPSIKEAKGFKGKSKALLGSLFSKSKKDEEEKKEEEEKKPQEEIAPKEKPKKTRKRRKASKEKTPPGEKAFNDRDGSGKRDGSWEDKLEKESEREKERKEKKAEAPKVEARYKSEKNVIDTIMDKTGKLLGMLTSGIGGLFGSAGSLLSTVGSAIGLGGKGGILGTIGKVGMTAIKSVGTVAGTVGRVGLMAGGAAIGKLGLLGAGKVALGTAAAMTGGAASAILGAATAALAGLGTVLASPVVLGAIAAGAVGYGIYKAYKYITRDDSDEYQDIRLKQYGLGATSSDKQYAHHVLQLEEYLFDGKIGFQSGQAFIIHQKVDKEELLSLFSIDKNDTENIDKFNDWFNKRFKPFFILHLTSLFSINKKVKLKDIKTLTLEERIKYLSLISYESGPYDVSTSPFKGLEYLNVDKNIPINAIKVLTKKLQDEQAKTSKKNKEVDKNENDAKKSNPPPKTIELETPKTLPKTNIATSKDKSDSINTGEDGKVIETPNDTAESLYGKTTKLTEAEGGLASGEGASQFIKLNEGVNLEGLNPSLLQNFKAMIQEYGETTGNSITVTSAHRDRKKQEELYKKDPKKAAKPGKSLHEFGLALDVDSKDLNKLDELGLMRKYGFTRPVGGEPWHTEPAGIQVNLNRAREDSNFANMAIESSLFKGGGGIGTIPNSPKYKRDTRYALSLMDIKASPPTDKEKVSDTLVQNKPMEAAKTAPELVKTTTASQLPVSENKPVESVSSATQETTIASTNTQSEKFSKKDQLPVNVKVNPTAISTDAEAKPNEVGIDVVDAGKTKLTGNLKEDIANISKKAGVDPNMMTAFAAVESSLNPNAKAKTSSASGLFQFTKATWNEQVSKHGKKYNLDPNVSPTDINASTLMASEYVKNNMRLLGNIKPNPNLTDVYLAHFLGPSGARKFLTADPSAIAAQILPEAARANQAIFYSNGKALTVGEVYSKISSKLSKTAGQFGIQVQPENLNNAPSGRTKEYSQSGQSNQGLYGKTTPKNKPVFTPPFNGNPAEAISGAITGTTPKQGSSPDASTPTDQPFIRRPRPIVQQQQPTVIGPNTQSNQTKPVDSGGQSMGVVSSTLDKSLNVQTEMLGVLKQILSNVSAENIGAMKDSLLKATNQIANQPSGNNQTRQTGPQVIPDSAVDLRRKII